MRTSTGKKAIRATPPTGIVGLENLCAGSRSTRNGSALSKVCLADQRDNAAAMTLSFEQALIEVWRQALVENAKTIELGPERFPVRSTPKRGLRQVDFVFEGKEIRGLEQNPQTKSRWAQLARSGKKVMQFLSEGRYVANVVDGKVRLYMS
jgi:hypothetical protein